MNARKPMDILVYRVDTQNALLKCAVVKDCNPTVLSSSIKPVKEWSECTERRHVHSTRRGLVKILSKGDEHRMCLSGLCVLASWYRV